MRYCSVQLRDRIFVKGYEFLSFTKNMGRNICKNISKNLSGKNRNLWIIINNMLQKYLKTNSEIAIQKPAEVTGNLVGNKRVDRMIKVLKISLQSNSEKVTNEEGNIELYKEMPSETYIFLEKRHKITDDLRLI